MAVRTGEFDYRQVTAPTEKWGRKNGDSSIYAVVRSVIARSERRKSSCPEFGITSTTARPSTRRTTSLCEGHHPSQLVARISGGRSRPRRIGMISIGRSMPRTSISWPSARDVPAGVLGDVARDHDLAGLLLGQRFEAAGRVDGVADHGHVDRLAPADAAEQQRAGVDADADLDRLRQLALQSRVDVVEREVDGAGGLQRLAEPSSGPLR